MTAARWDVSRAELYRDGTWHEPFRELRAQAPIHYVPESDFGPYWSMSAFDPIVRIEAQPEQFSSADGITIASNPPGGVRTPMFIATDRPKHTAQRRTVAPAFSPGEMARLSCDIRQRTAEVLDALPIGETLDWVDRVSIELSTQMLAILFDFPWDDRRKLTLWSDWGGDVEAIRNPVKQEQRLTHMRECAAYFRRLWDERVNAAPRPDLISMMIHSETMSQLDPLEFIGNLILLIVAGNDTTRNSMTACVYGLDQTPDERARLEADPGLIPSAISEIIRWQSPIAHMRRTALRDTTIDGHAIRAGDKVILWYLSANRDESVFPDGDRLILDRPNARRHLAFGHGIHRCVGARLAELQISTLLEEMAKRRLRANVVGAPERVAACFVHGYRRLPVELSRY
jgi:cytochrome P450